MTNELMNHCTIYAVNVNIFLANIALHNDEWIVYLKRIKPQKSRVNLLTLRLKIYNLYE